MAPKSLFLETIGFDWNKANLEKNWLKHKVSIFECEQTFFNQPLIVAQIEKDFGPEERFYALGVTDEDRKLFLVFTIRNRKIRVISARDMSRKERKIYEEKS